MPQLDGLRCVAVLLVIWEHAGPVWFRVTGGFGVRWFFVLSAYLITGILLRERGAPLGATLQAFYMRRALRILPPYYLLLAAVALSGIPLISGRELAAHALYLSNWWFLTQHWSREIGHLWSLAVEEQFYLVWPALVLMLPTRALPRLFVGSVLVALAWQIGAGALLSDGVRYRVLDATMHQGRWPSRIRRRRGRRSASSAGEGQRRLYYFKPGESRAPEPVLLEQQLQRAEYLPSRASARTSSRSALTPTIALFANSPPAR
jgi:peptidoglycan/LPS O-acetylase OafA/YrhL